MLNRLYIFSSRLPRPLAGILIFVVAVVVIEGTLTIALPDHFLSRRMNWMLEQATKEPAPTVQIMGDSTAVYGYDMETMNGTNATSPRFRQNAVAGTGPVYAYFFLKRQLASGHKPGAIIYSPATHTFGTSRVPLCVSSCLSFGETTDLLASGAEVTEVASGVLNAASYALRHREHIRNFIKARNRESVHDFWIPSDRRLPVPPDPPGPTIDIQSLDDLHWIYRSPFELSELNSVFVERFLQLAQDEGIPLYWVTMPVHDAVYQSRERFRFNQDYQAMLDSLKQRFDIIVMEKQVPVMNARYFFDDTHLNKQGAKIFTQQLVQTLEAAGLKYGP